jgi:hypothetical protein
VRKLDSEHLCGRVGVRVEVDESDRAVDRGAGPDVRFRDRMVASEHDRQSARRQHLPNRPFDRGVRESRVPRDDGCVAEVDDAESDKRVDPDLHTGTGREACAPDSPRAEAGPGSVGDEVVHRRADHRDVEACQLGGLLRVGHTGEREQARVVRLLAVLQPALLRVDHDDSRSYEVGSPPWTPRSWRRSRPRPPP